ncbi:HAMP domain-containing histidine kinase [Candidatus Microgenomates bacterium]|nr:HAMP domain-containing histidine kinase [Candidatus Microgenomates bacterium]
MNLSSIWLIAAFAYFSAQKVIKEEKAAFYNFRRLVRAQVQTQKAEEFFSVISHELKNSLAVILAHLERILFDKRIVLAPEIIFSLNEAKKATLETNRMIMNVLKTTRLDVGKIKFTPKNIDLSKIILETINHIKPQYEKAGLYLKYNNSNNYPIVSGDPEKIEEICLNLLLNALSFTKNGGVEISHRILSGYLWTVIKDTGTGIPKQNLPHVFKKFTSIRKDKQAGLGLGLYISSEYLKRMGGKIWCDSRQGHGTTFYFRLPIAES